MGDSLSSEEKAIAAKSNRNRCRFTAVHLLLSVPDGPVSALVWLIPLGFLAGGYGTLIGAGGGFVLAPALLLLYPAEAPETITSISLAVVFFNSLSGTLAYARAKRIDYKSGTIFAAATVPGATAGAIATTSVSRPKFNLSRISIDLGGDFFGVNPARRERYELRKRVSMRRVFRN